MQHATRTSVVRQIESLFDGGSVAGLTDRQLIERFVARRDPIGEAAFAGLVARHGPMVLGVCRQLLGDCHHAEDTFQATFMVLARKARSIGEPELLGNWLYGVALRTARKAKGRLRRQRQHEECGDVGRSHSDLALNVAIDSAVVSAERQAVAREECEALHDEVERLPSVFRLPIVLCYFEGLTLDAAAQKLRWPAGTVRSRLARARDKLRRGLVRRGIAQPDGALATLLSPNVGSAAVSSTLCETTRNAAICLVAGTPAGSFAVALAVDVLRSMSLHKLRLLGSSVFALIGVAGFLANALASQDSPKIVPSTSAPPITAKSEPTGRDPGRMRVTGRVLDTQGRPVPGAAVMVYAQLKQFESPTAFESAGPVVINETRCEGQGEFLIDAARTSSSRHERLVATAIATGYGVGWGELDLDADQPAGNIMLQPEQVIQGRLFDVQGRPVQGVAVKIRSIYRLAHGELEGPNFLAHPLKDVRAWPPTATSDADGRFSLRGLGRDLLAALSIDDNRFASQFVWIVTGDDTKFRVRVSEARLVAGPNAAPLTITLAPAQVITGRVTYADTGRPVSRAVISVSSTNEQNSSRSSRFEADENGKFRVNPFPGILFSVGSNAPGGAPYLYVMTSLDWPKGAVEQSVTLSLARGVVIGGKVTEEGSGRPIAGAVVSFTPFAHPNTSPSNMSLPSTTRPDGSFEIAAPAGPGYLVVQGPTDEFVLRTFGARGARYTAQPGTRRFYAHLYEFLDLKPESTRREMNATLRRGATVRCRVVGPDGQPVHEARAFSRVVLPSRPTGGWKIWDAREHGKVRNGSFELHGLAADADVPVYFLEPERRLGATVRFSGKQSLDGPVTVRLEPCGMAGARLVAHDGKPLAGQDGSRQIAVVVTPGPFGRQTAKDGPLAGEASTLDLIDPVNYASGIKSGGDGRITYPALIPGASYTCARLSKEFTVKPGESIELGDIPIQVRSR